MIDLSRDTIHWWASFWLGGEKSLLKFLKDSVYAFISLKAIDLFI